MKYERPFACDDVCRRHGEFVDRLRAERGCTRIDLPVVEPAINRSTVMRGWMGRAPEPGLVQIAGKRVNWQRPLEDPAEGCPGSWVLTRFILSLVPYLRRRTEHGARTPNPFFDSCRDELIWQWIAYLEEQEERYHVHCNELMFEGGQ